MNILREVYAKGGLKKKENFLKSDSNQPGCFHEAFQLLGAPDNLM